MPTQIPSRAKTLGCTATTSSPSLCVQELLLRSLDQPAGPPLASDPLETYSGALPPCLYLKLIPKNGHLLGVTPYSSLPVVQMEDPAPSAQTPRGHICLKDDSAAVWGLLQTWQKLQVSTDEKILSLSVVLKGGVSGGEEVKELGREGKKGRERVQNRRKGGEGSEKSGKEKGRI